MFGSKKKDAAFFDAFSRHAKKSVEAATMLVDLVKLLGVGNGAAKNVYRTPEDDRPAPAVLDKAKQLYAQIKDAETAADSITHDTIKRLHEHWITPFDRDDIHNLISRMDDVLDLIEAAAERIILFDVTVAPREATELAELRYGQGDIAYLELLDVRRGLFQAQIDLVAAHRDALLNTVDLALAVGGGLGERAEQPERLSGT